MDNQTEVVAIYVVFMLMSIIKHHILQRERQIRAADANAVAPRQRYRPPIPYDHISRFSIAGMDEVLCYHLMRFTSAAIGRFLPLLELETIRFRNRIAVFPEEALAVVLIRLLYPTRYWSMMDHFGHSRSWLSIVFNDTLIYLFRRYRKKLEWDEKRLTFEKLSTYAMAIHHFGGGSCFWGFIDGTLNATCRPLVDQEQYYSGHKRKHGYKYQAVVTPDGLVSSLMGPFIGRRGDWKMVECSGLVEKLRAVNGARRPARALYL